MKLKIVQLSFAGLLACFLLVPQIYAQGSFGTVQGVVKDAVGNPIEGVLIRIEGMLGGAKYKVETNSKGEYTHKAVGTQDAYRVIAQKEGFQGDFAENVQPGERQHPKRGRVDFTLSPGESRKLAFELTEEDRAAMEAQRAEDERRLQLMEAVRAEYNAGVQFHLQGEYQQAVNSFKLGLEKNDQLPALWANLSLSYAGLESYDEALNAAEKAMGLATEEASLDSGFYQTLGGIYAAKGDFDKANEAYLKGANLVADTDPQAAAKSYYNIAANMINNGQNVAATEALTKTLEADPSHAEAHYQLGLILLGTEMEKAVNHLKTYVELTPDAPNAAVAQALLSEFSP